jgi:uncharacterized protein (TIGR00255 family)
MMSMTGFGKGEFTVGQRAFRLEVRTYNNRFLDARIRLPWSDGELESRALALIRQRITRGRVEVSTFEEKTEQTSSGLQLDAGFARDLSAALHQLAGILQCDLATAAHLLQPMKELVSAEMGALRADQLWPPLQAGLEAALQGLASMRRQEGQLLGADIGGHLDRVVSLCEDIRRIASGEPERQRDRLLERIARLRLDAGGIAVDPARIAEEVALFADRCDVSEELARLGSHVGQLRAMLRAESDTGRRMEFMLQEMNRELNTIASKSQSAEVAQWAVEAKAAVEKMREQAQNIE